MDDAWEGALTRARARDAERDRILAYLLNAWEEGRFCVHPLDVAGFEDCIQDIQEGRHRE